MDVKKQFRKVKCPHCGWIRRVDVTVYENELIASVVAGPMSEAIKQVTERIKSLLAAPDLDEANAWVDMPPCPHCENVYRYNVRSGEVTK
jgi:uncharacterized Zn-finger protein